MFNFLIYKLEGNKKELDISKFLIFFYLLYLVISMLGYIVINYNHLHFITIAIYLTYILEVHFGAKIGNNIELVELEKCKIKYNTFLRFLFLGMIILTVIYLLIWERMINHYGSLNYIFLNALHIRYERIGGQGSSFVPVYYNYIASLNYCFFSVFLALLNYKKKKVFLLLLLWSFILIIFDDFQTFGRIGLLYAIFMIVGYFLVFAKPILTKKNVISFLLLFGVLNAPRLIRGNFDNFSNTVSYYSNFLKFDIPPFLYSVLATYIYYFSSLFSFNSFIMEYNHTYLLGQRLFTPMYNIILKTFGIERLNTIDEFSMIPFPSNIYTLMKDIISDFGMVGIVVIPVFIGVILGIIFRSKGFFADSLKLFSFGWIFYSPLYNAFSFGKFFIPFLFLVYLALFFRLDIKDKALK